ncbi:MAG: hypothetical protein AVDCRST_MAG76-2844, partial [uncultured Acidimicrobiales bacterium]
CRPARRSPAPTSWSRGRSSGPSWAPPGPSCSPAPEAGSSRWVPERAPTSPGTRPVLPSWTCASPIHAGAGTSSAGWHPAPGPSGLPSTRPVPRVPSRPTPTTWSCPPWSCARCPIPRPQLPRSGRCWPTEAAWCISSTCTPGACRAGCSRSSRRRGLGWAAGATWTGRPRPPSEPAAWRPSSSAGCASPRPSSGPSPAKPSSAGVRRSSPTTSDEPRRQGRPRPDAS